ncbi:MAG: diguanylate cyclase [Paracoccaceae bacterium]|uniref:diguanylate cyclase n=1 Tax=Yoonia sp. TaxID=2212373 RepID=UPI003265E02B
MLGKILIVDQIVTNRIALRAKLGAAQFDVNQAASFAEALQVTSNECPELILCASRLPDGDAIQLISALDKSKGSTRPPVIVICETNKPDERIEILKAGAEDVVSRPIDETLLLARIRTQVRAATSDSEWQLRDDTTRALGFAEASATFEGTQTVSIVGVDHNALNDLSKKLRASLPDVNFQIGQGGAAALSGKKDTDAYVIIFGKSGVPDMLRLMSALRCHRASRNAAMFVMQTEPDVDLASHALDMGANDLIQLNTPIEETCLRLQALLKRKRQADQLRTTLQSGLEAAVCDPLTGLHNRRYALPHLSRLVERAERSGKPLAVMLADMDFFKRINDQFGHAAGDVVLVETAHRLRENLRAVDLVARIGGEEFLVVLPNASLPNARKAAMRLCSLIYDTPYDLPGGAERINVSISIGLTVYDPTSKEFKHTDPISPNGLIARADEALYSAKEKGRNRVRLARPAA